jgi:hypothetical protein
VTDQISSIVDQFVEPDPSKLIAVMRDTGFAPDALSSILRHEGNTSALLALSPAFEREFLRPPREARRRIHIAAAKRDQSIRDYVWEAVEARLKHDLADELSAADLIALTERADPVLADLWNNPKDAAYDTL